jgi:hypothetical protein
MGQFKQMVKMETTEPSVELKLKKGGTVEKKMQMGGMPMGSVGPARGGMAPAAAPKMPALAARRRAMKAMGAAQSAPVGRAAKMMGMKEGGDTAQDKAMIKKAFKQHDAQEHMGGKGTKLKLKGGGMSYATGGEIPSRSSSGSYATTTVDTAKPDNSPAKTGGVKNGNAGGFKKGGMMKCATGGSISSEKTSGSYAETQMHTAKPDNSPAKTGEVKKGNAGGFATGGVMKANSGGYRTGGAAKKFAEGGRVQNDGGPEQMPQGRKPASPPVAISMLSGTYKKGGRVAPNNKALQADYDADNAPAVKESKMDTRLKYGPDTYQGQTIPAMPMMKKRGGRC